MQPEAQTPWRSEVQALTLMYTDMARSSEYGRRHGARLLKFKQKHHNDLVVPLIERHGGTLIRVIGDATQSTFPDAQAAARCAIAALRAVDHFNAEHDGEVDDHEIHIRAGLDHGRTLFNEQYGQTELVGNLPNRGARVIGAIGEQKDQVLVSDEVRALLDPQEFRSEYLGRVAARGFGTIGVHRLFWLPEGLPPPPLQPAEWEQLQTRAERRAEERAVNCWLVESRRVVPLRVRVKPRGQPGVRAGLACSLATQMAAQRAVEAAFAFLRGNGVHDASADRNEVLWWLDREEGPEPAIGLGVMLATVAAYAGVEISAEVVVTGSIRDGRVIPHGDLAGQLPPLRRAGRFRAAVVPAEAIEGLPAEETLRLVGVRLVDEAAVEVLGEALGLGRSRLAALIRKTSERVSPDETILQNSAAPSVRTRGPRAARQSQIDFRAGHEGYLVLLCVDAAGEVSVLLPDETRPRLHVHRGERVTYPGDSRPFEMPGPGGVVRLLAFVRATPLAARWIALAGQGRRLGPRDAVRLEAELHTDLVASQEFDVYAAPVEEVAPAGPIRTRGMGGAPIVPDDPFEVVQLH